jgi:hypothetical protein
MIAAAELAVQRMLTAEFIAADFIVLALERSARVSDGKGGYRVQRSTLAPQTFRLIPQGDTGGAVERLTADGKAVRPQYVLMGAHTVDLARGDLFAIGDRRYEVVFINENRQYEVKGEVAYLGGI